MNKYAKLALDGKTDSSMTPDEMCPHVFAGFVNGWSQVMAMREVAEVGIGVAGPKVLRNKQKFLRGFEKNPAFGVMIKDKKRWKEKGGIAGLESRSTAKSLRAAQAAVDAASLVFAHSRASVCFSSVGPSRTGAIRSSMTSKSWNALTGYGMTSYTVLL